MNKDNKTGFTPLNCSTSRLSVGNLTGFTLVEMLITIGIIGLLATIVSAGSYYARSYAKTTKAEADLSTIAKAIDNMALDIREWPGHQTPYVVCEDDCDDNEIEDLAVAEAGLRESDGSYSNWAGPYIQILTVDPWGNNYFFDTDYEIGGETKAVVGSYGPNGEGNNLYDEDDIVQVVSY